MADLIAYRQAREKLVTRVAEFTIETEIGEFAGYAYVTPFDKVHHYAFVYGEIGDGRGVPTRLHRGNVVEDVFGGAKTIHAALTPLQGGRARRARLSARRHLGGADHRRDRARTAPPPSTSATAQWREVGLGAQILRDLRISSIRLYATRSRSYVGLAGFGIEIEATEPLEEASNHRLTLRKLRDGPAVDC